MEVPVISMNNLLCKCLQIIALKYRLPRMQNQLALQETFPPLWSRMWLPGALQILVIIGTYSGMVG